MTDQRGRATGVEYFHQGERHEQPADVVILAASTIGNPRILLNSVSAAHPAGLANSSGLVGRYLMAEFIVQGFGLFSEQTQPWLGISAGQLTYREGYVSATRPAAFGGYQWQLAPSMKPNDLLGIALSKPQLFGAELQRFLETASQHMGMMIGFGSGVPGRDNRVELDERRDREGYRLARTVHRYSPELLALWKHMQNEARAVFSAAGAREYWTSSGMPTGHIVGGTIMGAEARDSVCDSFGRTHDVRNLYLAGAGLFPCSAGVSPTFTIHAVSLRSATQLVARWNDDAR
jgi:choline dehydrogenase-like flavoprotein